MSDEPTEVGRSFLRSPLAYIVGAIVLSVSMFGLGWLFDQWDLVHARLCEHRVEIRELELQRQHDRKLYAIKLSHTAETGKLLRVECDRELDDQEVQLQQVFANAITKTVSAQQRMCQELLADCENQTCPSDVLPISGP